MSINAIDRIDPVRIGELLDLYPSAGLRALALDRAEHISRASPVNFTRVETAREQPAVTRTATPVQAPDAQNARSVGDTIDSLRNQYATHRLTSAVQAFLDEHAIEKEHASTAIDLGKPKHPLLRDKPEHPLLGDKPEHPLLLQKYLVAFGNPPIEQMQSAVQANAASARVGPVASLAATRNTTEDALSNDPQTRAQVRRLRTTDA
jgi:hypothetical protein